MSPPDGRGRPSVTTETAQQPASRATASVPLTVPVIDAGADVLTAALAYAAAGIYVLPVARGSKNPGSVVGKNWHTKSSRDPQQIAAWFAGADHGIALHCGRSGLVVFDVDKSSKCWPGISGLRPTSPPAPTMSEGATTFLRRH